MRRGNARPLRRGHAHILWSVWLLVAPSSLLAQQSPEAAAQPAATPTSAPPPKTPFEIVRDLNRAGGPFKPRIINPDNADYNQNRWQVALVLTEFTNNFRAQFCGGSYLGDRWVVTAAHCAVQDKTSFEIFYGSGKLDASGKRAAIREIHVHKLYSRYGMSADIALLELYDVLPVDSIPAVTQPHASTMKSGDKVRVTGWGVINEIGVNSQTLMQADLPLQKPGDCNASDAYNGRIPPDMMCAGKQTGDQDTCQGDSGGPATLVISGARRLVGIVSTGDGCGQPKKYGIYTRVGTYEAWIKTTIQAADAARAAAAAKP